MRASEDTEVRMPDYGKSYPGSKDIREVRSQGEIVARQEQQQGGVPDDELLDPEKRTAHKPVKKRRKAA